MHEVRGGISRVIQRVFTGSKSIEPRVCTYCLCMHEMRGGISRVIQRVFKSSEPRVSRVCTHCKCMHKHRLVDSCCHVRSSGTPAPAYIAVMRHGILTAWSVLAHIMSHSSKLESVWRQPFSVTAHCRCPMHCICVTAAFVCRQQGIVLHTPSKQHQSRIRSTWTLRLAQKSVTDL